MITGLQVNRELDANGRLARETHLYLDDGRPAILLARTYRAGRVVGEQYIVNMRLVSRKTYEKARARYPQMPASDDNAQDETAELRQMIAVDRKQRRATDKAHTIEVAKARETEAFCRKLIKKGESADATKWIKQPGHTLGERDAGASRRLVARLERLGCVKIIACEIHDGNTGHVVVELPNEPERRRKIFRALDGLAEEVGYDGDGDNGQRLEYIKLD